MSRRVIEGLCGDINIDNGNFYDYRVGGTYVVDVLSNFEGKKIRVTIEEIN